MQLHAIRLKDSVPYSNLCIRLGPQKCTHFLRKSSEIKLGASHVLRCFCIFMLSQALAHNCFVCHWPCTQRALHKKQTLLISSPQHGALSQVKDSLETKGASREHLFNNLVFRPLWTFRDPYKTPSFFCRGLSGHSLTTRNAWYCGWAQTTALLSLMTRSRMGRAQLDPELKPRHFLKHLFTSKLRRFDSKIKKVPQIKDLKLLFEAIFKDKPVPDKRARLQSQNTVLGCFAPKLNYS